jgi:peptide/nickel transport system substrate-binding protein
MFPFNSRGLESVKIGISHEPKTLNPLSCSMSTEYELVMLVNRGLTYWDSEWKIKPDLARELPSFKNGTLKILKDKSMQVTWHLRKDLKWSDGKELTAEDFVFTHEMALNPAVPVISDTYDKRIKKMYTEDKLKLVVVWDKAFPYYDAWQVHPVLPKHKFSELLKEKKDVVAGTFCSFGFPSNGPFILDKWERGVRISFIKNENFHFNIPKIDRIIYRIIPDNRTLQANIASKAIDATCAMSMDQASAVTKRNPSLEQRSVEGMIYEHIDFNLENEYLKIPLFRKAIIHAINRQEIVKSLFGGRISVAHSWLNPRHFAHNDRINRYPFDPERSIELLNKAGFKLDEKSTLRDKKGRAVKLTLMSTSGNRIRQQIELIIQSYLKKIGIDLTIENKQPRLFFTEYLMKRKFPHLALYAFKSNPNTDGVIMWTRENIPSEKNGYKGQNYSGYYNEENEKLLNSVTRYIDRKKRREILLGQQSIWAEDLPSIPLFFRKDVCVADKRFTGYFPTGNITPPSFNAHLWDIKH